MHEDHILHKEIWHHHGLLFDADWDDPLMLLDDHIRHRDIWHHYKLLFDADTDYLLLQLSLMTKFSTWKFNTIMNWPLMLIQIIFDVAWWLHSPQGYLTPSWTAYDLKNWTIPRRYSSLGWDVIEDSQTNSQYSHQKWEIAQTQHPMKRICIKIN